MTTLNTNNYSLLLISSVIAFVAIFVFLKNSKSKLHQSFFVFALGGAVWMSGIGLISLTQNFFFDKVVNYGGLLFVFGFFLLARALPTEMKFRVSPLLFSLPLLIEAIFIIPHNLINSGMNISPTGAITPIAGPFIIPHSLLVLAYTIFGIVILTAKFRKAKGRERLQIKYLFLGTAVFMAGSVLFAAILPALGIHSFILLGPLSSVVFIGLIAYAIGRHELLDIRIIIQRGLIYTCLFVFIAALYITVLGAAVFIANPLSNAGFAIVGIITTIVGIFGVPVIDRILKRMTDEIFFKDGYDYAEALHTLTLVVSNTIEFEVLLREIEKTLQTIFKCKQVELKFKNDSFSGDCNSSEDQKTLCIPIVAEKEIIGHICLDEKRSGDPYNNDDIKLINTFTYQAATALSRARLYKQVQEHATMLESKVAERTKDLRLAQENQKQLMIEISHNLQTPITIFQTKIDQFKKIMPPESGIYDCEGVLKELSDFIYKLLELANLEHGKEKTLTNLDFSRLVEDITEEIKIIADHEHIAVNSSVQSNLKVLGIGKELREAILNILSNAIKYMRPEDTREIKIALIQKDGKAQLSISDTGIGISEADQNRIFERFFRVKKDAKSFGAGLGLAITEQIIKDHRGTIKCESKENVGSTFVIELPLRI